MRIEWPLMLLALLLVPALVAAYRVLQRGRTRYAVRYTNIDVLAAVAVSERPWRRYVPAALVLLALTVALVALARPQVHSSVAREEASIVLTVDVSGSMRARDVKPTRLGAAQQAIRRFLDKVPDKYRLGLVTFSSEPYVASSLTDDHELIRQGLEYFYPGRGTAIGDGLARSVEVLQPVNSETGDPPPAPSPSPSPSAGAAKRPLSAIILLSDGAQTRGLLQPLEGAARAKSYGIPIYTIALGTPNGVVQGRGGFTRPVPPDPVTLAQIAKATGGEFYETKDEARLNEVYDNLASRLGTRPAWREATSLLLGIAAALALAAGALAMLWMPRLP